MMMIRTILKAAALLALATGPSWAADALRSHVTVTADVVTVGDFYPGATRLAQTPLFRSPDLGTQGEVPALVVAERARAAGYLDATTDGLRQVVVERLAHSIGMPEIQSALAAALVKRHGDVSVDDLDFSLTGLTEPMLVSADLTVPASVRELTWNRANGRLTAQVRIHTPGRAEIVTVSGRALEMVEMVAARLPIARGTVISRADLTVIRMPRGRVQTRDIVDADALVGLAARRSIRTDQPLRKLDFEPPVLVKRGERVTLIYQAGGLTLTSLGQALGNGAKGDVVDILNLQSRRTVSGVVRAHDQVVVGLGHARMANLQETN